MLCQFYLVMKLVVSREYQSPGSRSTIPANSSIVKVAESSPACKPDRSIKWSNVLVLR